MTWVRIVSVQCHEERENACAEGWAWHIPIGQAEFLHVPFHPDFCHNIVLALVRRAPISVLTATGCATSGWRSADVIGSMPLMRRDKSL